MLPAGQRRPDEVVVGEPVVEHRNERLPLRVALIHRRPRAAPLLHLRQRWAPPAATAPRLPLPRSRLLRERVLASRVWRFLSASAAEPLRCEQRAEGDPMLGAERGSRKMDEMRRLGQVALGPVEVIAIGAALSWAGV